MKRIAHLAPALSALFCVSIALGGDGIPPLDSVQIVSSLARPVAAASAPGDTSERLPPGSRAPTTVQGTACE